MRQSYHSEEERSEDREEGKKRKWSEEVTGSRSGWRRKWKMEKREVKGTRGKEKGKKGCEEFFLLSVCSMCLA